ncbi:MAG: hypothetical protein II977_08770 [Oscillospiraceae bacterium]|nr:hypothetical protein [Oscillospiraceae bacterium]
MDDFYRLIGTLCFSAFISGTFLNFVNVKHTAKVIRFVAVLYMISSLIKRDFAFKDIDVAVEDLNIKAELRDEYIIENAAEVIKQDAENILKEKNISYESIQVHINKEKDKVSIDKIVIFQPDLGAAQETAEALKEIISADRIEIEEHNDKFSG